MLKSCGKLLIILMSLNVVSYAVSDDINKHTAPPQKSLLKKIIDSYNDASNTDKTLKHLLDAKMYLSTAEHDLLVSHDKDGAQNDIDNTLSFLREAETVSSSKEIKIEITQLVSKLTSLKKMTAEKGEISQDDSVDKLLELAQNKLMEAKKKTISSLAREKEISDIHAEIQRLRDRIEHDDLRSDYESAMQMLNIIIRDLSK